ncbi:hypothetical protein B0H14DRAFT_3508542 [Mycena olivaceomarginata]|nr:hypothetical protein B0H14DRAFT_3508542 [Mycena olivaceomarginata]
MAIIANMNHPDPDESLVGLLDSHRQRWQDLTLKLPFNRFYQFLSQEPLPMLERLVVDAHSIPRAVDAPITAFQLAPMLKHLTTLELTAARAEDCLECLRRAPHLLTCSFEIQEGQQSLRPVAPRSRLTALTMSGSSPSAIFMYATLPGLEELNFAGRSLNGEDLSQISSLVSRVPVPAASSTSLLEALPSLESLDLAATEASTIMTLFASLCSESFLPQLQHLSLSHHRMADSNIHEMFYDMAKVLARRGLLTPEHVQLQSFSLTMQYEETAPNLRVIQKLQTLADRGMSLSIRNQHDRWI